MTTDFSEKKSADDNLTSGVASTLNADPRFRLQSLDTIRGIAVLGALFVSIWMFGGYSINQQNGLLLQAKGGNYRLWGTVELLFEGKMRALISIVFGAGMILFLTAKREENKVTTSDLFTRRQLWLMAFGLINAFIFLWPGDLLFHLGIMGILLFPFVRLNARQLLIAAIVTTLIFSAKNYWNYSEDRTAYSKYSAVIDFEKKLSRDSLLATQKKIPAKEQKKDSLSKQQKADKSAWEGIANGKKYDPKKNDEGFKDMRSGSVGKVWNYLLPLSQSREAQWTYRTGIWDLAGMILLGMALFKFDFFDARFSRSKYLLIGLAALTAGLLLGWFRLQYNQYVLKDYAHYVKQHGQPYDLYFPFERALSALGYASLVLVLMRAGLLKFLWRAFARVGQLSLSNYLLQSIFCTIFFTGLGMGYFGRLQQYQLYLVVVEISIVQTVFSVLWLRYYYYGPAEWLWRCLVYRKWLPNKIRSQEISETPATASLI